LNVSYGLREFLFQFLAGYISPANPIPAAERKVSRIRNLCYVKGAIKSVGQITAKRKQASRIPNAGAITEAAGFRGACGVLKLASAFESELLSGTRCRTRYVKVIFTGKEQCKEWSLFDSIFRICGLQ